MNKPILLMTTIFLVITGCASDKAYREGERLLNDGKTLDGIRQLEQAVRDDPSNVQYRTSLVRARETYLQGLIEKGDAAMKAGRYDEAEASYRQVMALHPDSPRARSALEAIEVKRRNQLLVNEARQAYDRAEYDKSRSKIRAVLAREPGQVDALALLKQIEDKTGKAKGAEFPKLSAAFQRPITLEFRDASIRMLFDAISRQSGINFVFDKDVRTDTRLTIFARDTAISDALDMLLRTGQLAKRVLNENTLLIYPATAAKHKEYQELVVKGFFLSNTDAKQVVNMVRTMVKTRDIYIDEKLNLIMVRDTPEAIRLVEKLIQMADRPEPEVMLEIEIMEVKRSRLQELGVQWPTNFRVLLPQTDTNVKIVDGVVVTETVPGGQLTIETLKNLTSSQIGVFPPPSVNVRKDTSDVNILANPRIRIKNKEKAKIHVGDKVPVITSNVTSTGVTSESVSYLDVGLKVDVEPEVRLDQDVEIKVGLEVSNIVQQIKTDNGTIAYQLGSRNATTNLRLKNGETQVLAGLISDEDRTGANKVPGFGDLPLLGRLFSNQRDELSKTEIVMLITPHIIRNIERPELNEGEFFAGTDSAASDQPLLMRPGLAIPAMPAPAVTDEPAPLPEQGGASEVPAEPQQPVATPAQ